MRVLSIGSDRSKRGIMFPYTPAYGRQQAYARALGHLDIIALSLQSDGARCTEEGPLRIVPTGSRSRALYLVDALRIARALPRPDVVTAQDPFEAGLIAWRIARRFRAPLHVQVHTDFLSPAYARHSLPNRVRALLAGFVLRRAARVRAVSDRVKESIERTYRLRAPVTVLPIYADVERIRTAAPDAELVEKTKNFRTRLLVVSRLEPEKNVALAIEAFAAAAPESACLIIVGDGSEHARLENLARARGVAERVVFAGGCDAASCYPLADLVLVTSHYEGYGLVTLEALAAGKPVLSTDVGIAREAGAIVADEAHYPAALTQWFESGPRFVALSGYPYRDFKDYVGVYCEDIEACAQKKIAG